MQTDVKSITEGLETAIRTETDGYHFYTMAARSVTDIKGRQVLEILAQEELGHLRFLKSQYESFLKNGKADTSIQLEKRVDLSGDNPIFSGDIQMRIGQAHFEMSALSIGIHLEINSQRYYREQADKAGDPDVSGFFKELADWESGHYQALLRQQEALKEEYWARGGFSPY